MQLARCSPEEIDPRISRALDDVDALITILPLPFAVELAGTRPRTRPARRSPGPGVAAPPVGDARHRRAALAATPTATRSVRDAVGDLLHICRDDEAPRIAIEVLGPTRVFVEGQAVDNASARRARVRQLLALLAVEPRLRRDRAMALLWPDLDQTAASRNLRVTLTYLRQLFREPRPGPPRRAAARREVRGRRLAASLSRTSPYLEVRHGT